MCGIAGRINFTDQPVSTSELTAMEKVITHRGPDDEGTYAKGPIGLANRRLAIIDLSPLGHQPMTNEDGRFFITYNGEVYNFQELVPELVTKGHKLRGKSDTEVILHAYEEWGAKALDRLKGIFGIAIWDSKKKELFLARDRFGIKPIYYYHDNKKFIFGSEIKSILVALKGKPQVDPDALVEYFTFQNILSDRTLFAGIRILPPGHYLTVSQKGDLKKTEYWDFNFREEKISEKEAINKTLDLFKQAVARNLVSDVPVASYLSGGMDSGSVTSVASQYLPHMMTFTGGFDLSKASGIELVFDERKDAEIISNLFKTEHYEMVMHSGDMARTLPKLIWHLEDLRVGMCYQNYNIAHLASKFGKVVLAGTGGDEMFAGYPWRYESVLKAKNHQAFEKEYYDYWQRLVKDKDRKNFFSKEIQRRSDFSIPRKSFDTIANKTKGLSNLNKALYFEAKTFLHGLLVVEDKVSMAHSLETRVPFLDEDLVDFATSLPENLKIRKGKGKYVLRKALSKLLPKEIIERKKQGFSPPDESWYRGETMDYIKEILLTEPARSRGFFNQKYIERILQEHLKGRVNHRLLIWSLLSFEWWCRNFLDQ